MALAASLAQICFNAKTPDGQEGHFLLTQDDQLVSPVFEDFEPFIDWLNEHGWQPTSNPVFAYRVLH